MRKILRNMFVAVTLFIVINAQAADKVVTSKYVVNPSFEQGITGWTITNMSPQTNSSFTKKVGTTYLEKWTDKGNAVGSASVTQVIEHLAAGKYRLNVMAQNIQQGLSDAQTGATIYADKVTNSTVVTSAQYYNVEFITPGTKVTIGFRAVNATGNWLCVDNFRLYYVGPDFDLLQTAITNAETVITKAEKAAGIQPLAKANLLKAIEAAKAITADSEEAEMTKAAEDLADYQAKAEENANALKALKTALTKAKNYLSRDMAEMYLTALQTAVDEATELLKLEDDRDITPVMTQLEKTSEEALTSYQAKRNLMKTIASISELSTEGKEGSEELSKAISDAEAICNSAIATPQEMNEAQLTLENAILYFRIQNGTGSDPIAKTGTVIQGATEIFGRASFSFSGGATAKEKGFCWSENPEPTIFDNRSTTVYSNNGDIYAMQGLKPATVYYVRAYAYTNGYKLSYGDVIKVPTRPLGNVGFSYGYEGDAATNQRIYAACEEAVWMWNNIGGIQHFHLDAHYRYGAGAGTGTAECSYGGYMSVSQNTGCQRTGTILHEGAHGLGMVPYTDWTNSIYRTDGDRGDWLGPRVDRVIQFLENSSTAKLHGDNQHMWPYGINGAGEDSGSPILYRANALLVEALSEDGLTHSGQGFLTPGYVFETSDDTKYYIKSESEDQGLTTSYLRYVNGTTVSFTAATADEAFADESYAWYITFDPKTCYYKFKNAASGRYLSMTSGTATASISPSVSYQLLESRTQTTYKDFTFAGSSYWIVNSSNHNAMNATTSGASSTSFNHANNATTQRWLLLTGDEVTRFAESQGETVGVGALRSTPTASALQAQGGYGVLYIKAIGAGLDVEVFTLDGRRMNRLYVQKDATAHVRVPRGIYLVGGQKVLVR